MFDLRKLNKTDIEVILDHMIDAVKGNPKFNANDIDDLNVSVAGFDMIPAPSDPPIPNNPCGESRWVLVIEKRNKQHFNESVVVFVRRQESSIPSENKVLEAWILTRNDDGDRTLNDLAYALNAVAEGCAAAEERAQSAKEHLTLDGVEAIEPELHKTVAPYNLVATKLNNMKSELRSLLIQFTCMVFVESGISEEIVEP